MAIDHHELLIITHVLTHPHALKIPRLFAGNVHVLPPSRALIEVLEMRSERSVIFGSVQPWISMENVRFIQQ